MSESDHFPRWVVVLFVGFFVGLVSICYQAYLDNQTRQYRESFYQVECLDLQEPYLGKQICYGFDGSVWDRVDALDTSLSSDFLVWYRNR